MISDASGHDWVRVITVMSRFSRTLAAKNLMTIFKEISNICLAATRSNNFHFGLRLMDFKDIAKNNKNIIGVKVRVCVCITCKGQVGPAGPPWRPSAQG